MSIMNEQQNQEFKTTLTLLIKPTYEGAMELTDSEDEDAVLLEIGMAMEEVDVEVNEAFEIPRKCVAEYEETLRVYSENDGDLNDPFDPPTSLSAGRYVFEGDAIRVLELYSDDGDEI
jgi:hypothetical protein